MSELTLIPQNEWPERLNKIITAQKEPGLYGVATDGFYGLQLVELKTMQPFQSHIVQVEKATFYFEDGQFCEGKLWVEENNTVYMSESGLELEVPEDLKVERYI
jgi:hypothetical protein